MFSVLSRIVCLLVFLLAGYFSLKFSQEGFEHIQGFKQLERIVPSSIIGLVGGESQIAGLAYPLEGGQTIRAPKSNIESLYYRYLVEREETDSDGNSSWVTQIDRSRSVDFLLVDYQGEALIKSAESGDVIDWSMPISYRSEVGSLRYTEWRIEPQQEVLVIGWSEVAVSKTHNAEQEIEVSLSFQTAGAYIPVISKFTAAEVRGSLGRVATLKIWGGVSLVALSLFFLICAMQVHRILAYLSLLMIMTNLILGAYGVATLRADVTKGAERISEQLQLAEESLKKLLVHKDLVWLGWESLSPEVLVSGQSRDSASQWLRLAEPEQQKVLAIRSNLYYLLASYERQISPFPEHSYAWFKSLDEIRLPFRLTPAEVRSLKERLDSYQETRLDSTFYWWILGGFVLFMAFSVFGLALVKVKRLIENVATSESKGVSYGIAEVKGKVSLLDNQLPSEDDTLLSNSTKGHKPETEQVSDTEQAINTKPASDIESKRALRSPLSKQSCVW